MTAVTVRHADDHCRSGWDHYVGECANAEAYHLYAWRYVLERAFRHDCYYLEATTDGGTCGVLPLAHLKSRLFGNFLVSLPGFNYCGVLANTQETQAALIGAARDVALDVGAEHIELRHRDTVHLEFPHRKDKVAMRLGLPESDDVLWKEFKPKLRAQIRRPIKDGATSESGGAGLIDSFYTVFARNMRDLGTPVYPKSLFFEMCRQFPEAVGIHVVRVDGQPTAAGVTVTHGNTMEIPFASSLREFNRSSVNMLLYWTVLQSAIRAGCTTFDFGRSTPGTGTYRFKAQWGAEPQQLHWHYLLQHDNELPQLNPQNPKFALATRLWSHLPVRVANLIGPLVVRHLP